MSIPSSALLVELNISVWQANKLDRAATDTVTSQNGAGNKAAQVRKNLMAGTNQRKDIADYAGGCRLWHHNKTLPWADKGPRLMPTSLFLDYKSEANVRKATFEKMVGDFLVAYPSLIQQSQQYMGTLFDPNDYPTAEEIKDKFAFNLVFSPVPESGDFRIDVPVRELEEVKQGYEDAFNARLGEAMREPWERLHKVLTTISEKLADKGDEEKRRYHETLITNATDLCSLLTHLNVTADPKLEEARRQLEQVMNGVDIVSIKESPFVREDTKKKVDKILKQFSW
jgi:hypothetical protein